MARESAKVGSRSRRTELRRTLGRQPVKWRHVVDLRMLGWSVLIWTAFTVLVGALGVWTHEQPMVAVDRVMHRTRTVRAQFEVVNELATEDARNRARQRARRVYVALPGVFEELRASLEQLPQALADAQSIDQVEQGVRQSLGLTPEALEAIKNAYAAGQTSETWLSRVRRFEESLRRGPIIDYQTYVDEFQTRSEQVELRAPDRPAEFVRKGNVLNVESQDLRPELRKIAAAAGFQDPVIDVVVNRVANQPKPTFTFDPGATSANREEAASRVEPQKNSYPDRQVIFRAGDRLTPAQLELYRAAIEAEIKAIAGWRLLVRRGAVVGMVLAIAVGAFAYIQTNCPRIRRNPARVLGAAGLMGAAAALSAVATAAQPTLLALTVIAPTLFVGVITAIAYDRRAALAIGGLQVLLVAMITDQPIGIAALMLGGVWVAVWLLPDVRERNTLIRMGVVSGGALAAGSLVVGAFTYPVMVDSLEQAAWDAGMAGAGALLVAGVTLFILPMLERMFDITTGLTLVELRDPKEPLLRMLQQRAPGTYNHSLNVASLGEAAADAVGANGLLTYVGALYHDIGKMNKPDYFIENQIPGFNRHDKLSPAMSLLIVVGHVKDGVELAREFGLPRSLHHFIEAHHGTTLVEYFYHRAKKLAEENARSGVPAPLETEYRYPGPKPRTKEVAIMMVCDAVESAARAMADPTSSRIEQMVRAIAAKRLNDGQFDECDLTLRELNIIVETISKTLAAIYHGRIAYPGRPPVHPAPLPAGAKPAPAPRPNGADGAPDRRPAGASANATITPLASHNRPQNPAITDG